MNLDRENNNSLRQIVALLEQVLAVERQILAALKAETDIVSLGGEISKPVKKE